MDIKKNKYPEFWKSIRRDFNKKAENIEKDIKVLKKKDEIPDSYKTGEFEGMDKQEIIEHLQEKYEKVNKINKELKCPMNYIGDLKLARFRLNGNAKQMDEFFVKHELDASRRKSKRVEELIEKYSFNLYNDWQKHVNTSYDEHAYNEHNLLLRDDFEDLIEDIRRTYISRNYLGLMSWLIDRAFCISSGAKKNKNTINSKTRNNKSTLLKVLYEVNNDAFLKCFAGGDKADT